MFHSIKIMAIFLIALPLYLNSQPALTIAI